MKRLLVGVGIIIGILGISKSYAESYGIFGQMDGIGIHKSTVMVENQVNMFIATGNIIVVKYNVLSTGTFAGLQFQQANSTNAGWGYPVFYGSAPFNSNGSNAAKYPLDYPSFGVGNYVLLKSTWGWAVTKTGTARGIVEIYWDYWK